MRPTARFNKRGFTIVEVLVALVILAIAMLGILDAMLIAVQKNLENYSRDESVRIAGQYMDTLRNTPFQDITAGLDRVTRTYKQAPREFIVRWTPWILSDNSKSIDLQVSWTINGITRFYGVTSIISRRS